MRRKSRCGLSREWASRCAWQKTRNRSRAYFRENGRHKRRKNSRTKTGRVNSARGRSAVSRTTDGQKVKAEKSRLLRPRPIVYTVFHCVPELSLSRFGLPCLEVAELLGDHFADVDAQPVDDPLRQVRVRRAAEHLDVRHSVVVHERTRRRDQVGLH